MLLLREEQYFVFILFFSGEGIYLWLSFKIVDLHDLGNGLIKLQYAFKTIFDLPLWEFIS